MMRLYAMSFTKKYRHNYQQRSNKFSRKRNKRNPKLLSAPISHTINGKGNIALDIIIHCTLQHG